MDNSDAAGGIRADDKQFRDAKRTERLLLEQRMELDRFVESLNSRCEKYKSALERERREKEALLIDSQERQIRNSELLKALKIEKMKRVQAEKFEEETETKRLSFEDDLKAKWKSKVVRHEIEMQALVERVGELKTALDEQGERHRELKALIGKERNNNRELKAIVQDERKRNQELKSALTKERGSNKELEKLVQAALDQAEAAVEDLERDRTASTIETTTFHSLGDIIRARESQQ